MHQFYETWCEDLKSLTTVSGIGDDKRVSQNQNLMNIRKEDASF